MRLGVVIPLVLLSAAGVATLQVQGLAAAATAGPKAGAQPTTRLGASIEDDLAARRARLDQQARAYDMKEQLLVAKAKKAQGGQPTAGAAAANPAAPRPTPAGAPAQSVATNEEAAKRADARILQLAKVYQQMKAADAARVFENLDIGLQVKVASVMRDAKFADIMEQMQPEKAIILTTALAVDAGAAVSRPAPSPTAHTPELAPAAAGGSSRPVAPPQASPR